MGGSVAEDSDDIHAKRKLKMPRTKARYRGQQYIHIIFAYPTGLPVIDAPFAQEDENEDYYYSRQELLIFLENTLDRGSKLLRQGIACTVPMTTKGILDS